MLRLRLRLLTSQGPPYPSLCSLVSYRPLAQLVWRTFFFPRVVAPTTTWEETHDQDVSDVCAPQLGLGKT